MTQEEIVSIIPNQLIKELIDKKLYNRVIEIMMSQISSYEKLNRLKLNLLNLQEFPYFMKEAFNWKSTQEKYTGWFKIIFNKDYYEECKKTDSIVEDILAGKALTIYDIYYTTTARTFDRCAKELMKKDIE